MDETVPAPMLDRVVELLHAQIGDVSVSQAEPIRSSPRNRVTRIVLTTSRDGGQDPPLSVIVKQRRGDARRAYDPNDLSERAQSTYLAHEIAGLQFLHDLDLPTPQLLAADYEQGILIVSDLGHAETLASRLQGTDPHSARDGFIGYAQALGRLHARGSRQESEFTRYLHQFGPRNARRRWPWTTDDVGAFYRACEQIGVKPTPAATDDINKVVAAIKEPGPFLTVTHGDSCAGNDQLNDDAYVFLDLELVAYRHIGYDMAYLRMPFPSCGFPNKLPDTLIRAAEAAHRAEAAQHIPELLDDERWAQAVTTGCAYWSIWSIGSKFPDVRDHDQVWGSATIRQRIIHLAQKLQQTCQEFGVLSALGTLAGEIAAQLQMMWPETEPIASFAAFTAS